MMSADEIRRMERIQSLYDHVKEARQDLFAILYEEEQELPHPYARMEVALNDADRWLREELGIDDES